MKSRGWRAPALAILLVLAPDFSGANGPAESPPKKILVELYTSPTDRSGPATSNLLGRLAKLGYGPDRVASLTFHVDASGEPGAIERFRRLGRPSTPLLMVDGRDRVVGPDQPDLLASLARAAREPAKVTLALSLTGEGTRRSLSARVEGRSPGVEGRELVVGVALAEASVTTRLTSGEVGGRTLVGHQVVRRYSSQTAKLEGRRPKTLTFPVEILDPRDAGRFRVTAFVQDRLDGTVYQAESIPWPADEASRGLALRRRKRASPVFAFLSPMTGSGGSDASASCLDCGSPFSPEFIDQLPPNYNFRLHPSLQNVPLPKC